MTKRQADLFPGLQSSKKYVSDYPLLVLEWHPTKNGNKLLMIIYINHKKVWWQCKNGHEWQRDGYSMKRLKSEEKCPHCRIVSSDT